jgi:hypothetical protein
LAKRTKPKEKNENIKSTPKHAWSPIEKICHDCGVFRSGIRTAGLSWWHAYAYADTYFTYASTNAYTNADPAPGIGTNDGRRLHPVRGLREGYARL